MLVRLQRGSATITLSGDGATLLGCTYVPRSPDLDEQQVRAVLQSGARVSTLSRRNVTESASVILAGTATEILAQVRAIEAFFPIEEPSAHVRAEPTYLEFRIEDTGDIYRSEILMGRVEWPDRPIAPRLAAGAVEIIVLWTRRFYWEGALTQLPLTSAGTPTPTTNYATVYNNDDETANSNWFQVAGTEVGGVIPAPLKLEFNNASGSFKSVRALHLANYAHFGSATIDPILRGVQASYASTSWSFAGEATVYRWALPAALLVDTNGRYCRVLVTLATLPDTDTLARARLQLSYDGITFYDLVIGEQTKSGGHTVLDLGAMPIPPGGPGVGNAGIYLTLTMQAATAAGDAVVVDWVQIMPAGHGLYRLLLGVVPNIGLAPSESLIDDGIEGLIYTQLGGNTYIAYRNIHAPIHVWPNMTQRLRLIKQGQLSLGAGEAYGVKAWVRPRRLSV